MPKETCPDLMSPPVSAFQGNVECLEYQVCVLSVPGGVGEQGCTCSLGRRGCQEWMDAAFETDHLYIGKAPGHVIISMDGNIHG